MSTTRVYDANPAHTADPALNLAPTIETANGWAAALIYHLRNEPALLARIVAAVNNTAPGATTRGPRIDTVNRLAVLLRKATTTELSADDVDLLIDDLGDGIAPPACEAEDCTQPQWGAGACWDHYTQREAVIARKAGESA